MSYDPVQQNVASGYAVDAGLQGYMRGVLNTMAMGLAVTGLVAWGVANVPALYAVFFGSKIMAMITMLSPLAFLWLGFTPGRVMRSSAASLRALFYVFSGVMGLSFAAFLMMFSGESIARAFFITAATFAATAIFGHVTRRDLTKMGSFLMMGLIGIVIASLVNMFLQSAAVHFMVSFLGVFIFTGLTAFEVQRLKETYRAGAGEANDKVAVMGALSLYMNFVNLFQIILQFTGGSRE